ncbi:MAG: hypothetical protein AAB870_02450 [Patescibacteria group bacterium]
MKKTAAVLAVMVLGSMSFVPGVNATSSETVTSTVSAISLKVIEGPYVSWTTQGQSASGFKVVWSKNTAPVYPNRDSDRYHYLSDPNASKDKLEAFSGEGTYYVRVCEYLGGRCGTYSNEVSTVLGSSDAAKKAEKEKALKTAKKITKEKILRIEDVKYFEKIEKIGDSLYGVRIEDNRKKMIQNKLNAFNEQMKRLQAQIDELKKQLAAIE